MQEDNKEKTTKLKKKQHKKDEESDSQRGTREDANLCKRHSGHPPVRLGTLCQSLIVSSDQTGFTTLRNLSRPWREKSGITLISFVRMFLFNTVYTYSLVFFHVARVEEIKATGKKA